MSTPDGWFVPDFCRLPQALALILSAELVAFVLVLARPAEDPWEQLGLISFFIQWIAIGSTAVLCLARRILLSLSNTLATGVALLLPLAVTAGFSAIVLRYVPGLVDTDPDTFLARNVCIGLIVTLLVLRYAYVQHQWRAQMQAQAEARMQALQARIRPHFLFNSMNTIASLTRIDPARAETVVEDLAELFRASLSDASIDVQLQEELALIRRYLDIEATRLGERLQVDWDVDTLPGETLIPRLTLQPLAENAVYHGISYNPEGGTLRIAGNRIGGRIHLSLENPIPKDPRTSEGQGIALENTRQRLLARFGGDARMRVSEGQGRYRVDLDFPYTSDENSDR
ncbi:MAG: sensor histidine kinase [Chromatiales bacterium]|nr:sensor histidine kinase [Chromatiales bacterium]